MLTDGCIDRWTDWCLDKWTDGHTLLFVLGSENDPTMKKSISCCFVGPSRLVPPSGCQSSSFWMPLIFLLLPSGCDSATLDYDSFIIDRSKMSTQSMTFLLTCFLPSVLVSSLFFKATVGFPGLGTGVFFDNMSKLFCCIFIPQLTLHGFPATIESNWLES